ncbi:MAG: hypothetical protein M1814_004831 [Vezdaea aestivalis]|nr:MAG: hypothetical protein M1814_004831 [Vezdaea aestivalis]
MAPIRTTPHFASVNDFNAVELKAVMRDQLRAAIQKAGGSIMWAPPVRSLLRPPTPKRGVMANGKHFMTELRNGMDKLRTNGG